MKILQWLKGNTNGFLFQIFVGLSIIFLALFLSVVLFLAKPKVVKVPSEPKVTLVNVLTAKLRDEKVTITTFGTVQEHRKVSLQPEVSGRVIEQSPNLVEGGIFHKGEMMLKIDPRDYQSVIEQEKAAVQRAEFDLKVEHGKQIIAKREWQLLDPSKFEGDISEELALRQPHLVEKQAALEAAQSRLAKAELDLERTTINAPFNAVVITESVDEGQVINPQTPIATLVATDEFRVKVNLPYQRLQWINIPTQQGAQGPKATIIQTLDGTNKVQRQGYVVSLLGDVDSKGRMVRLLVAVDDPLGLKTPSEQNSPLLLGSYVEVDIEGPTLSDVFVLPRKALRESSKVWIKNNANELEVRDVNVSFGFEDNVIIDSGLNDGDEVITSSIGVVIPGMKLKVLNE